jgi:hypothetical protein
MNALPAHFLEGIQPIFERNACVFFRQRRRNASTHEVGVLRREVAHPNQFVLHFRIRKRIADTTPAPASTVA